MPSVPHIQSLGRGLKIFPSIQSSIPVVGIVGEVGCRPRDSTASYNDLCVSPVALPSKVSLPRFSVDTLEHAALGSNSISYRVMPPTSRDAEGRVGFSCARRATMIHTVPRFTPIRRFLPTRDTIVDLDLLIYSNLSPSHIHYSHPLHMSGLSMVDVPPSRYWPVRMG